MSVSDLVGEIEGVRRRTRRASSGAAVPLALLGLLVALAAPVYALASDSNTFYGPGPAYGELTLPLAEPTFLDRLLWVHSTSTRYDGIGWYWLLAAPLAFAAIAAYYHLRARRTGLSIDGWRVAAVGGVVFGALVATMAYGALANAGWGFGDGIRPGDLVSPFLVVALGVFVLAWVERSVTAAVAGVAYVAALGFGHWATFESQLNNGWQGPFSWGFMVLWLGVVLLVAAGVAGLAQRTRRA
ncbi:MAG TPA: hypothetical protein VNQ77_19920 [Frankiaceae bacterium]|nr:hypothetical protein [Frankiaceae bacterium]